MLQEDLRNGEVDLAKFIINKTLTKSPPQDYPDAKSQPHVQAEVSCRLEANLRTLMSGDRLGAVVVEKRQNHISRSVWRHRGERESTGKMTTATLASVAERRAMLKALGERPGLEAVEAAQQAIAEMDAKLVKQLEDVYNAPPPEGVNVSLWRSARESELREAAEAEKGPPSAVIELDELHQLYEGLLEEEERSLDGRDYKEQATPADPDDKSNTEAADLLQDALENKRGTLDLSSRYLSYVPELIGRIETLVSLDLSGNQLQLLPDSVAGLVNLESLKIGSNQLKSLPDSIGLLARLKYLDMSTNSIKILPESLGRCSNLVEVNGNFNQIEFIPSSFGLQLVNLQKLDLHLNKLPAVPSSICDLKALKRLDLHMNKLRGLPAYIGNLSQLEYLDVSSNFNDLVSLPESMGDLISLTYCDLSFNQIRELPVSFGRLHQLKTLKLDGNPIELPPMEVVEKSHEAVMEYMLEVWKRSLESDQQVPGDGNPSIPKSLDLNSWVSWAGNSPVGAWIGSWWGSSEAASPSTRVELLQGHRKVDILDQQL